jgi:integrase
MATVVIEQVVGKKVVKFKARVRLTKKGKKLFEQSKTFEKESQAKSWAKKLAVRLDLEGVPTKAKESKHILIRDLITLYLDDEIIANKTGRSKAANLRALRTYDIGLINAHELTANDLVEHCRLRINESHAPKKQTEYHDVTYLKSVIEIAEPMFGFAANIDYHQKAIPTLINLDLIGRSERRERRPTADELRIMEAGLLKRQSHRAATIPLVDIFHISILTCMRASEVTRVVWADFNEKDKTLIIRNRKDPRNKRGNDCKIPLCNEALAIIKMQRNSSTEDKIFPYNSRSIGAAWQRVCKENNILDLHYHDLRAEGACRLFEKGLDIVEVSKITGHRDINVLNNIYLRLDVSNLHKINQT